MKKLLLASMLFISTNALALDSYSTADEGVKKLIKNVINVLKAPDSLDTEKKLYDAISFAFDDQTQWNTYWLGYNDLSASKIKNPQVTFIDQFINTSKHGMFFFSFIYDKDANQILLNKKHFRYGSKKDALSLFTEKKDDEKKFVVKHERDNYALIQDKGNVSYSAFNLGSNTGSVAYISQSIIDL